VELGRNSKASVTNDAVKLGICLFQLKNVLTRDRSAQSQDSIESSD
jgi:hypothetical protein